MSSVEPEVDLLSSIERGEAPRRILEFAARGFVPLAPSELVRAVGTILGSGDPELCPLAEETFQAFSAEDLKRSVLSDHVRPEQLDVIARRTSHETVLEPLIRHHAVLDSTLSWLAERIPPFLQDVLVTNQTRLLACPEIVERLFENLHLSTDIRRRADEFLEEFFLKKIREEQETEMERLRAEAEILAKSESDQKAALEEIARKMAELEGQSELAPVTEDDKRSLLARIATMSVVQKIRLAWRGNKEERLFLIRDTNRLVTAAVLKSPKTREAEAETIANLKSVSEDVLRGITFRKEWMRKYGIMSAIIKNPRSPIDVTLPLVLKLTVRDLKVLASDRNVPDTIRASARREVQRKEP